MKLQLQTPKKALKPFLKQKPLRSEIDIFKTHLITLLDKINVIDQQPKDETEEHLKNNIRDFLRDTYYKDTNAINTKDKKDLVIHLGKTTDSDVGVIIEAKRPNNIGEMITADNANKKALHELVLYYLDERNKAENNQLKQLIITNVNEWYIIDANYFDKHIYRNTQIKKLYETKQNDKKDNPFFYEEIAKIFSKIELEIPCISFDIREYNNILRNSKKDDDKDLIALYKILSPQHLLKIATPNDSNSLNEKFYKELLHIIGLEEAKENGKNIIRRVKDKRNAASLIEATIEALHTEDVLHRLPDQTIYGETKDERVFNVSLELCITWINRILFLKLLEGQLVTYHQGNKEYCFLNTPTIHDFDELFKLFHKVLAVNLNERSEAIKAKYSKVPYLNSSLFEISDLEDQTIKINALDNSYQLELIATTILKDAKKKLNKLPTLDYLFQFLDAYDFASEGTDDIQEDNKTIINASVLGKVFEKINGYKDGSIFTPAFITMYMCKQSIRLAVLQKFNDTKKWNVEKFEDLYNKIEDKKEANEIINTLKICDPAVGSGHFLVSALNEIIAIKSELGVLMDANGKTLRDYEIEIINDELIITDENTNFFTYNFKSKESNRIQKTLFHEKQTIIENCLFGVDINPNSVKICRLRLWIELLKNAYYKEDTNYTELETLPNIDINIKCGNSLISRFKLDDNLTKALKSIKYDIKAYRGFVQDYKHEKNRDTKRALQHLINTIKNDFRIYIGRENKEQKKLNNLIQEFNNKYVLDKLFSAKLNTSQEKDKQHLKQQIDKQQRLIDDTKNNVIYKNAFEWRFEFPEVLNDKGDFEGFDLIVGNPPYIKEYESKAAFDGLREKECYQGKMDIWYLFGELGITLLKPNCNLCYIATNNWTTNAGASKFRNYLLNKAKINNLIDFGAYMVFENASIQTMIMLFNKNIEQDNYTFDYRKLQADKPTLPNALELLQSNSTSSTSFILNPTINKTQLLNQSFTFNTDINDDLLNKIKSKENFNLREKADKKSKLKSEIANGIHHHHDIINSDRKQKLNGLYEVGTGIFVLNNEELKKLQLTSDELKIIKPQYSSKQVTRFFTNPINEEWVIYTKSDIGKENIKTKKKEIDNFPKIKAHLDKFESVITSDFRPYGLHRAREQHFFEGEKIAVLRKCAKEPMFSYSNFECYLPAAFYIIQSNRINLKYLTGLLNSKLVAFWLRKKGKMQGNNYQLDKEPLLQIPIHKPTEAIQTKVATIVDKIITAKQQNQSTIVLEKQIDELVYKLYDLTAEEIKIVENN